MTSPPDTTNITAPETPSRQFQHNSRRHPRTSTVCTDIEWLQKLHAWPGLAAIGRVDRVRETDGKVTSEIAYYLLSAPLTAERFGEVARAHWGVENGLHWVLDVTMNEDQSRNRKDHGSENIAMPRRLALNLAKLEGSKGRPRQKDLWATSGSGSLPSA